MMIVLIGLAGGLLLGLRFKFLVLIPATLMVAMASLATGGVNWSNAVATLLVMTALDIGYLCGVAARGFSRRGADDRRVMVHRN
jgi:hypothetical protein